MEIFSLPPPSRLITNLLYLNSFQHFEASTYTEFLSADGFSDTQSKLTLRMSHCCQAPESEGLSRTRVPMNQRPLLPSCPGMQVESRSGPAAQQC